MEPDYKRIALDQQIEIEQYRIKLAELQRDKAPISLDLSRFISWIESHYLFCIVVLLAASYALSSIIDIYGASTRRQ